MINFNVSASFNVIKILFKPGICLPHHTVPNFGELPIPLDKGFRSSGYNSQVKAVVLDKDDCFAYPETNEVYQPYQEHFEALRRAYPGRKLLIVSNTAGAKSWDRKGDQAVAVESATGITVLRHAVKKPGCGAEIMDYFKQHPETGVTHPSQVAIVGDRLTTDMMLANMMGAWGVWVKDGVKPLKQKSIFARLEHRLEAFLRGRGYDAHEPVSPFEE